MIFINPMKTSMWKSLVDRWTKSTKPFMSASIKAYISKPIDMAYDLFGKVCGDSMSNASTAYQCFYSWIQWTGIEYLSETYEEWLALRECMDEYLATAYERELSQRQYQMLGFSDNEYDEITYEHDDDAYTGGSVLIHTHDYGNTMPMSSYASVGTNGATPARNLVQQLPGITISNTAFTYDASHAPTAKYRLMANINGQQTVYVESQPSISIPMQNIDGTAHSHLCMTCSARRTDEGMQTINNMSASAVFSPMQIAGGYKTPATMLYSRTGTVDQKPEVLTIFRSGVGDRNQNVVMYDIPIIPSSIYASYPAAFKAAYLMTGKPSTSRYISPESERSRRHSLAVTTEPYQTFRAIDDGSVVAYNVCGASGATAAHIQQAKFLVVRGTMSTMLAIDAAIVSAGYNSDIIDTVTINDASYIDDMVGAGLTMDSFDTGGLRADAGIGDAIDGSDRTFFRLTQDFLGDALWEQLHYKYPGANIAVVGAGLVHSVQGDSVGTAFKLYCAGIDPTDASVAYVDLPRCDGKTAGVSISVDTSGERLGPVVKIPGMGGYVRLLKKTKAKPDRNGYQAAAVYEVEIPYCTFGLTSFRNTHFMSLSGQVLVQDSYIKAGSWRRAEILDADTKEKIEPATSVPYDYNWLGINERVAVSCVAGESRSVVAPTQHFIATSSSTAWNACTYTAKSIPPYHNQVLETDLLYTDMATSMASSLYADAKRMVIVDNQYWKTDTGCVGYPGHEYPAYKAEFDISDLASFNQFDRALSLNNRWFIGRAIGGGNCALDAVDPSLTDKPFIKSDLGLWIRQGGEVWRRIVANSRDTSINSILMADLLVDSVVIHYDRDTGLSNPASSLIKIVLSAPTGFPDRSVFEYAYANVLYNTNIQCLYQKVSDGNLVYCSTRSYKIVESSFNIPNQLLTVVAIVEPDASLTDPMADAEASLLESKFTIERQDPYDDITVGLVNILAPQSNASLSASSNVETSRIFHVFSRVPNSYKGTTVEYIGVYQTHAQASYMIQHAANLYWMYYNAVENSFFVWTGIEWALFYKVDDWVGIKTMFIDAQSDEFYGSGDITSPWYAGCANGKVSFLYGHQTQRFPLPEHMEAYIEMPAPKAFIENIIDYCKPSDLALRYIGFLTRQ